MTHHIAPDVDAERSEIRSRLAEEMRKLPEQRRTAFRLSEVDGMTTEQIVELTAYLASLDP